MTGRPLTPAEREEFEERAAIIEYDGQLPRAEAERLALALIDRAARLPLQPPPALTTRTEDDHQ